MMRFNMLTILLALGPLYVNAQVKNLVQELLDREVISQQGFDEISEAIASGEFRHHNVKTRAKEVSMIRSKDPNSVFLPSDLLNFLRDFYWQAYLYRSGMQEVFELKLRIKEEQLANQGAPVDSTSSLQITDYKDLLMDHPGYQLELALGNDIFDESIKKQTVKAGWVAYPPLSNWKFQSDKAPDTRSALGFSGIELLDILLELDLLSIKDHKHLVEDIHEHGLLPEYLLIEKVLAITTQAEDKEQIKTFREEYLRTFLEYKLLAEHDFVRLSKDSLFLSSDVFYQEIHHQYLTSAEINLEPNLPKQDGFTQAIEQALSALTTELSITDISIEKIGLKVSTSVPTLEILFKVDQSEYTCDVPAAYMQDRTLNDYLAGQVTTEDIESLLNGIVQKIAPDKKAFLWHKWREMRAGSIKSTVYIIALAHEDLIRRGVYLSFLRGH